MEEIPVKILNRYITTAYLKLLGLAVGSFVAIYLVIDFLEKINRFSQAHGKPIHIALYFLCKIPAIINQVMPLAVLMATLLTLGAFSRSSEIVAMQSSGISLKKISYPIIGIAFSLSLFTFVSNEVIVPNTSQQVKYIEEVLILGRPPVTFFRLTNIWYREGEYVLQARLFIPPAWTLKGVTLWQTTKDMQPVRRLEAEDAIWNGHNWSLRNVVQRDFSSGKVVSTTVVKNVPIPLKLQVGDLKTWDKYTENMSFFTLKKYAEKLRNGGYDATRYLAQMHAKISLPFACLIMAFLGIPFALRGGRSSGIALGIGLSIGIGFVYFIINSVLISFGQTGVLSPLISAWAANFIFALSAIWLTLKMHH
jgi:lipopolysaccharide export system permease protein